MVNLLLTWNFSSYLRFLQNYIGICNPFFSYVPQNELSNNFIVLFLILILVNNTNCLQL
jgi:hypothetical protein